MASIPQFYANQSDFTDLTTSNPSINGMSSLVMEDNIIWGDQRYGLVHPLLDNTFDAALLDHHRHHDRTVSSSMSMHYYSDASWSPALPSSEHGGASLPEVSDLGSHHNNRFFGINNIEGFQSLSGRGLLSSYQQPCYNNIGDFADECYGLVEDVKPPACPNKASTDNLGIQGNQVVGVDQENIKVGRYSEEERKERILRYLRKRNQRNFNKTIKYACRKTLADRRVRVRGRFARNNELCEDEITMKENIGNLQQYDLYAGTDSIQFQLRNEEEDWLQEAMESLVFLSHSSPEDI